MAPGVCQCNQKRRKLAGQFRIGCQHFPDANKRADAARRSCDGVYRFACNQQGATVPESVNLTARSRDFPCEQSRSRFVTPLLVAAGAINSSTRLPRSVIATRAFGIPQARRSGGFLLTLRGVRDFEDPRLLFPLCHQDNPDRGIIDPVLLGLV